ncbi:cupin domain-containing protein [Chryseolinea sp. H1M3-3]|uniref:cupin domain-containing protein n=1 Tax=Chryseolinea sp. H1M3-3 TaxID=3034144 RepID=UPI0023ECD7C1|nr:cupin domain-containing protein [Chryseolinea sp. H1M3-3]
MAMERRNFLFGALALFPSTAFGIIKTKILRTIKGFKVNANEARFGERYKMKGVTLNNLDIKISGSDTDGDLAVLEQTGLTPNGGPPLHVHPFQDEWFYVVEGEYLFQVGDEKHTVKTGDTIFLPRTVPHAFIQRTEKGKMIVSYLPAGKMEAFFKATDKWTSPPSKEEIAKVFEDHDMKVVGPPLKSQ